MRLRLWVIATALGGVGGFLGSIIGAAFGHESLFLGGFIGGVAVAPLTGRLALWRHWISRSQYWPTTLGAAVGFLAAALIAVNTLSSPVGPILSTCLIGIGALVGRRASS